MLHCGKNVDVIDDLFRAVVEHVYIVPFKVAEFKARLEHIRKLRSGDKAPSSASPRP